MRAARANGVYAVNLKAVQGALHIGLLVLLKPVNQVKLIDIDSVQTIGLDLSKLETGTYYKLKLPYV